jgi:hypothetical protein
MKQSFLVLAIGSSSIVNAVRSQLEKSDKIEDKNIIAEMKSRSVGRAARRFDR